MPFTAQTEWMWGGYVPRLKLFESEAATQGNPDRKQIVLTFRRSKTYFQASGTFSDQSTELGRTKMGTELEAYCDGTRKLAADIPADLKAGESKQRKWICTEDAFEPDGPQGANIVRRVQQWECVLASEAFAYTDLEIS